MFEVFVRSIAAVALLAPITANAASLTFEEVGSLVPDKGLTYFEEVGEFTFTTLTCNCPNPENHQGIGLYNSAQASSQALRRLYNSPDNIALLSESTNLRMNLTNGGVFDLDSVYLATAGASPSVIFHIDGYKNGVLTQSKDITVSNSTEIGGSHLEQIGFVGIDKVEWSVSTADGTYFGTGLDTITYSISAVPIPASAWLFGSALIGLIGFKRKS